MDKTKRILMLVGAALLAGGAAVFAFFYLFIPQQRRKGAEELLKVATGKAEALRAAAKVVEQHTEQQVAKVEARVEVEKTQDSMDFANDFIKSREKKS